MPNPTGTAPPASTPAEVRERLIEALQQDLIGPERATAEDPHSEEILPQAPSRWYLTGFLVPFEAPEDQRSTDDGEEELDTLEEGSDGDDDAEPDKASGRRAFLPSSLGLSVLVDGQTEALRATVSWGDYVPLDAAQVEGLGPVDPDVEERGDQWAPWRRERREETVLLPLDAPRRDVVIPRSGGLQLVTSVRTVDEPSLVPTGTRSVSVFLVNRRSPASDSSKDKAFVFQAALTLDTPRAFVPRPDLHGRGSDDEDERMADLQYRDDVEYGVGHNVSARALLTGRACHRLDSVWLPRAEVERVEHLSKTCAQLYMEVLSGIDDHRRLEHLLAPLIEEYGAWLGGQGTSLPGDPRRRATAESLLAQAEVARQRIAAGVACLKDPDALSAFREANAAVARALRQRHTHDHPEDGPEKAPAPTWRPFQLAFILMNLPAIVDPSHGDRQLVDLLFFPTGGGKTEAYLGLAAFTMVLRRLRRPGIQGAGVTVLMRYTLRLLTLDQLDRAATLVCALELARQRDVERLGLWPFEIGLWVGQAATPNRMGFKGEKDKYSARARTIRYLNDDKKNASPIPLERCPWCGAEFNKHSFALLPNADKPRDLRVVCANRRCAFGGRRDNPLPILSVDEPIYRRLPAFLLATVDKLAGLPWEGRAGALFGKVDRFDLRDGFYGQADPALGRKLREPLSPPDLIIQDELHLISGPLGTMVGIYETAVDALSASGKEGQGLRPKVIASTATVRRARRQIQALFGRSDAQIFPPPGPDRRDSFFAQTVPSSQKNARVYLGIGAQGRSLKVVLLRTYLALLAAAQRAWVEAGGKKAKSNPADPYMTLVGYFNALRELGGSRRIVEDEVNARLHRYGSRRLLGEAKGPFADRKIADIPVELTSRVSTNDVAEAKRRLAQPFAADDRVDVALATNMISVGLDILRLGLMVVLGQPRTAAEYIQATSRVGRDEARPGLVVALLNVHRPRDRSHFERFGHWHSTFYRAVEATSVTPFSSRARDLALAAVTVAMVRHLYPEMTAPTHALRMVDHRTEMEAVATLIASRAAAHDKELDHAASEELRQRVRSEVQGLLDTWEQIAHDQDKEGVKAGLQYQREAAGAPPLLHQPTDTALAKLPPPWHRFKAKRSMRNVEPSVNIWVRNPDGIMETDE